MNQIGPKEVAAIDGATIIDVREPDELAEVRVEQAIPMPMSSFLDHINELPDGPLYVLCRSGARSGQVTAYLEQKGYDATNISGGILEWEALGLPVLRNGD